MNTITTRPPIAKTQIWSAVGSMALCVAMLIASEFMPVSLLTPIAADLRASAGMAGQAISVSGLFAVLASLFIATIAGRFDRRHVLMGMTALMLASLILIAQAPNFAVLMAARAFLGISIGGFWSLATATVMRLVPEDQVPKALGVIYTGNAVATAFAAPIGSYVGGVIGWRGVFWALVPLVLANLAWQWVSLPAMPPQAANPVGTLFGLLKRRNVAFAMVGVMLTFAGAFAIFTYLRPFLETYTRVSVPQLSLVLLGLGLAGFAGTYGATALLGRHLNWLLAGLPVALGAVTLALLGLGHKLWAVAPVMVAWGALNSAIPVAWSAWLTKGIGDQPESGGGLMVGAIQLSIMSGAALGGLLLDHLSIAATLIGGTVLLVLAALTVGNGNRIAPRMEIDDQAGSQRRSASPIGARMKQLKALPSLADSCHYHQWCERNQPYIKTYSSQPPLPHHRLSAALDGIAEHESALERDLVTLVSFVDARASIVSQPLTLSFRHEGRRFMDLGTSSRNSAR